MIKRTQMASNSEEGKYGLPGESWGVLARNVNKFYGKKQVLFDMNLHLPRGKIYGLLGPSGCGKTTLLNSILGALKVGFVLPFDAKRQRFCESRIKFIGLYLLVLE